MSNKIIAISQACAVLGLSPRQVRELCASGKLVRVNGITEDSIAAYQKLAGKPERTPGRKPQAT